LGERHLRQVVQDYVEHYHEERPHQSLSNKLIAVTNDNAAMSGLVLRRQRFGGVLNYHHRAARRTQRRARCRVRAAGASQRVA
jgi:hypothetical protein